MSSTCILLIGPGGVWSPVASIHRNADGTWHAEGRIDGFQAVIAGGWQGSLTVDECAAAIAAHLAPRRAEGATAIERAASVIGEAGQALKARKAYHDTIHQLHKRNATVADPVIEDAHRLVYGMCPGVPRIAVDRIAYWELQRETVITMARRAGMSTVGL